MTDDLSAGLRRALEKVNLLAIGEVPGKFVQEDLKASNGGRLPETMEDAYKAYVNLNWTAEGAAMLAYKLLQFRERETGTSVADQIRELGNLVTDWENKH